MKAGYYLIHFRTKEDKNIIDRTVWKVQSFKKWQMKEYV